MVFNGDEASQSLRRIITGFMERKVDPARLRAKERLREDLGFDSVLIVDLMVEIELKLGVYFDPYEHDLAEIFQTVGTLERFVLENKGNP